MIDLRRDLRDRAYALQAEALRQLPRRTNLTKRIRTDQDGNVLVNSTNPYEIHERGVAS